MQNKSIFTKDFTLVAIGQIISLFGNQILRYALPLYVLNQTGSSTIFGIISASVFLPLLLLYPIGGILADRLNKKNIMVVLDACTAIVIIVFILLLKISDIIPLIAVTMMVLYGIQGAYQPAVKASIPVLVSSQNLMRANSVVDVISSLSSMAGPVMGGILYTMVGLKPILYISVACFLLSAIMEVFIDIPYHKASTHGNIIEIGIHDVKESFVIMFKEEPSLWKMSLIFSMINLLLTSLVMVGAPVLITQHLGFSQDMANRLYGYEQGIMAAGSVLGGILASILSKKLRPSSLSYLMIGCALCVIFSGMALQISVSSMVTYTGLLIGCSCLLIFETLFTIQILSYIQLLTPHHLIGKVTSCVMCVCMCTNPIGQCMYGFVFEHSADIAYLPFYIAGAIVILMGICTRPIFKKITNEVFQIVV